MVDPLNEQKWRLLVGVEAKGRGCGGISAVALAAGIPRTTLMPGINEIGAMKSVALAADPLPTPNSTGTRQAGGGRKRIELKDKTLLPDLLKLEDSTPEGTQSHRCAGHARACEIWLTNSSQEIMW